MISPPHPRLLQALKEKTELQAQLAAVNAQLQAQMEQAQASQERQGSLTAEVASLRQNSAQLERDMLELQGSLESRNASLSSLGTDLQLAEEQYQRLLGKMEEMQQAAASRDKSGGLVGGGANLLGMVFPQAVTSVSF